MDNLFKIKNISYVLLASAILSFSVLQAMEDTRIEEIDGNLVCWVSPPPAPKQPISNEEYEKFTLNFRSASTGQIYQITGKKDCSLFDYIKELKKQKVLKKEGNYNYKAQTFVIKSQAYKGDIELSYEDLKYFSEAAIVIQFTFV